MTHNTSPILCVGASPDIHPKSLVWEQNLLYCILHTLPGCGARIRFSTSQSIIDTTFVHTILATYAASGGVQHLAYISQRLEELPLRLCPRPNHPPWHVKLVQREQHISPPMPPHAFHLSNTLPHIRTTQQRRKVPL